MRDDHPDYRYDIKSKEDKGVQEGAIPADAMKGAKWNSTGRL